MTHDRESAHSSPFFKWQSHRSPPCIIRSCAGALGVVGRSDARDKGGGGINAFCLFYTLLGRVAQRLSVLMSLPKPR